MGRVLEIGDHFRIIKDALTLFNIKPAGSGGPLPVVYKIKIDPTRYLWFPKLALKTRDGTLKPHRHSNWLNTFSADGAAEGPELTEKWLGSQPHKSTMQGNVNNTTTIYRAIFAYSEDASGTSAYRFAGVFHITNKRGADGVVIYTREAVTLSIDDWI